MSEFLRHQPCPECGSKDNCSVWDDGHEWCFGCGYYKPGVAWKTIIKKDKNARNPIAFPVDSSDNLPIKAQTWYKTYGLNDYDAAKNKFKWSEEKQWLIMPVYGAKDDLLMYQARCFGTGPKYFTKGNPQSIDHIIGENSAAPVLFVVEDLLSAIKISKIATVMPLWGSSISNERLVRLSRSYTTLVIWLDYDKAHESVRIRERASNLFKKSFIIIHKQDPKCLAMPLLAQNILHYKNKY